MNKDLKKLVWSAEGIALVVLILVVGWLFIKR